MLLAIDSGNTNIKWGIHDCDKWQVMNVSPQRSYSNLASAWQANPFITKIVISNVAGVSIQEAITDILPSTSVNPLWIDAVESECGLNNNYYVPNSLGSDRWAAMVSVWNRFHAPCLVVSVGTAMTIDMISDSGEFVGGTITPGFKLLANALVDNTNLSRFDAGIYDSFSLSTENALFTGAIDSLVGVIEKSHRAMLEKYNYHSVRCIITGGDAAFILPFLDSHFEFIDNLVLKGLVIISQSRLRD